MLVNAAVEGEVRRTSEAPLLVCDSRVGGPLEWDGPGVISGVDTAQALRLGAGLVLDQLPIGPGSEMVSRCFGLHDDPKRSFEQATGTFCNMPWTDWLGAAGLAPEAIWPERG